nr:ABC transporter permease [Oscillospiraceae bacterium]
AAIITIAAIVLVSIWLTGILTMVNTVNTGVLNRADELMMLRTVGMSKKAVRRTVRLESMIFSGTATLIGCIIGLAGAFFLFTKMNLGSEDLWVLPLIFTAIGVALLLTVLLNLLVASVAAKPALRTLNARMEEGGIMQ